MDLVISHDRHLIGTKQVNQPTIAHEPIRNYWIVIYLVDMTNKQTNIKINQPTVTSSISILITKNLTWTILYETTGFISIHF